MSDGYTFHRGIPLPSETRDEKVERIAQAYFESPLDEEDTSRRCWDHAHPGDKAYWRDVVRFVLREAGLG